MLKNKYSGYWLIIVLFLSGLLSSCNHDLPQPVINHDNNTDSVTSETSCDTDTVYFTNTILPLFVSNCAKSNCHNGTTHAGGIKLNNYNNIITTGDIQAFNPFHGDILDVISTTNPGDMMPPQGQGAPLSTNQINLIVKWINQGAQNNFCDACDTANVTYSKSIAPLITSKCKGCHQGSNPGGGIPLVTYTDVKAVAQNGSFYGTVMQNGSFSPMPKGSSKLPDCDIAKIRIWIQAGAPNN